VQYVDAIFPTGFLLHDFEACRREVFENEIAEFCTEIVGLLAILYTAIWSGNLLLLLLLMMMMMMMMSGAAASATRDE